MLHHLARGARFVRLHQEDVRAARFDWQGALRRAIEDSTAPVTCLEATSENDSWAKLRAEVAPWLARPLAEWVQEHGHRLNAPAAPNDT